MSSQHIRKETNGKCKGTNEEAHDFNDNHERHQPARDSGRREDVQKAADTVGFDSHSDHESERAQCKPCGHIHVARGGTSPR